MGKEKEVLEQEKNNIVLNFGNIVSELEEKNLKLLKIKDNNGLFVVDCAGNLYGIEPYYAGGYLDRFIGEKFVISFERMEQPIRDFEDWRKEFMDASWVKSFIERVVKIEYPNFTQTHKPLTAQIQEVSAIDTDRVNPLVVLDEYGVDKDKIMDSARVSVVWDVDGIWVDFNYSYSAEEGYRDSTLVFCEIYEDGKPNRDVWEKAVRIGEELKDMYNVPLDVARDDLNNLQYIAAEVREKMVGLYGDGTDLCGHCIEASEKIAERIREELGIEAITVEGWCRFDDDAYGSDRPWDPHTWVEVPSLGLYVDVTADQFNFGMERKNKFPGVIVQKGLPYGMIYDEPQWDVELEDEIKEENSSLESKIQSAESRAAVLRSGTFVLTKDPERKALEEVYDAAQQLEQQPVRKEENLKKKT